MFFSKKNNKESPDIYIQVIEEDLFSFCPNQKYDLIIACCFADLFNPKILTDQFFRISKSSFVYLPITFSGSFQT